MSTPMELNKEYEIKQGKNVVILTDQTVTIQAKYTDMAFFVTLVSTGADATYTIPFMKKALFKLTAASGGTGTAFDYSPSQG